MSRREDERPEPVTITDKRRIDPETGAVRSMPGAAAPRRTDVGGSSVHRADVHDAEPSPAEEAGVVDAEVLDAEVLDAEVLDGGVLDGEVLDGGADDGVSGAGDQLDPVQVELVERTADLQRVSAEYANYRRRVDRDRQAVIDAAKASVVGELLGVLDDLERARSHGDLAGPLKSVADKLAAALTNQGLTGFGAVGDAFDPAVHEAVSHSGDGGAPVVSVVMRQGYRFGERVLRPAMVAVEDATTSGPGQDPAGPDPTTGAAEQPIPGPVEQ